MAPYFDVVSAYRDDLGVLGKLRLSAFQWFFSSSPEAFTTPRYGPVSTDAKLCLSSSSAIE